MSRFKVGDYVHKWKGDYEMTGHVVSVFHKHRSPDVVRLVVEDDRGMLMIFNETQLKLYNPEF